MRLIDLDRIKPMDFPSTEMDGFDAVRYLNALPTIDAVPVVRCSECKLHTSSAFYPDRLFCQEHGRYVDPDGYCYLGARKEGADNR